MNISQQRIIKVMIAIILLMLLFPPFQIEMANVKYNMGYEWLFTPPVRGWQRVEATVNVAMLLVQWISVLLVGGLGLYLTKDKQQAFSSSDDFKSSEKNRDDLSVKPPQPVAHNHLVSIGIGALRVIRGIFGLVFAMQIFGILPSLGWLGQPDEVTNEMMGFFIIKLVTLVISGLIFHWLRSLINNLYAKKLGSQFPALISSPWKL